MAKQGNSEELIYRRKSDSRWVGRSSMNDGKHKTILGKTRTGSWSEPTSFNERS